MLIDWFTVGAQALNFLVLAWLLKRFLYKPILEAIDAREKRVAAELADADARRAEAAGERDAFRQKNESFERERAALLGKATEEANAERRRLLDEARTAADQLAAGRQASLRNEARSLNEHVGRRAREEVFAVARTLLAELAGTSLEARMTEEFIRRLAAMDDGSKARLAAAFKGGTQPALLRTAFDLPQPQRAAIEAALRQSLATDVTLHFETAADLVCGIELSANGQKLAWSIADALKSLDGCVDGILQRRAEPGAQAGPATK